MAYMLWNMPLYDRQDSSSGLYVAAILKGILRRLVYGYLFPQGPLLDCFCARVVNMGRQQNIVTKSLPRYSLLHGMTYVGHFVVDLNSALWTTLNLPLIWANHSRPSGTALKTTISLLRINKAELCSWVL